MVPKSIRLLSDARVYRRIYKQHACGFLESEAQGLIQMAQTCLQNCKSSASLDSAKKEKLRMAQDDINTSRRERTRGQETHIKRPQRKEPSGGLMRYQMKKP